MGVAHMDPVVLAAVIAGGTGILGGSAGGGLLGWLLTRRQRDATVELTEVQADEIRQQIYDRLVERLEGEIARLQARVADLEAHLARLDFTLRERTAELVGVQTERDSLRIQLAAANAELQAREREIGDLRARLVAAEPRPI